MQIANELVLFVPQEALGFLRKRDYTGIAAFPPTGKLLWLLGVDFVEPLEIGAIGKPWSIFDVSGRVTKRCLLQDTGFPF